MPTDSAELASWVAGDDTGDERGRTVIDPHRQQQQLPPPQDRFSNPYLAEFPSRNAHPPYGPVDQHSPIAQRQSLTGLWLLIGAGLAVGALLLTLIVVKVIYQASHHPNSTAAGYHPTDQRSYDMGYQAGLPNGYAGHEIREAISAEAACRDARDEEMMFTNDPQFWGLMTHIPGRPPASPDDFEHGCDVAAGVPGPDGGQR